MKAQLNMILATNVTAVASYAPAVSTPTRQSITLLALDGRRISSGVAEFAAGAAGWTATMSALDRPGNVATHFYADGVREVIVRFADGRTVRARLSGTRFLASSERVCELTGPARIA